MSLPLDTTPSCPEPLHKEGQSHRDTHGQRSSVTIHLSTFYPQCPSGPEIVRKWRIARWFKLWQPLGSFIAASLNLFLLVWLKPHLIQESHCTDTAQGSDWMWCSRTDGRTEDCDHGQELRYCQRNSLTFYYIYLLPVLPRLRKQPCSNQRRSWILPRRTSDSWLRTNVTLLGPCTWIINTVKEIERKQGLRVLKDYVVNVLYNTSFVQWWQRLPSRCRLLVVASDPKCDQWYKTETPWQPLGAKFGLGELGVEPCNPPMTRHPTWAWAAPL